MFTEKQKKSQRGAGAIEFIMLFLFLWMLVALIVDFGVVFVQRYEIGTSTHEALRYVAMQQTTATNAENIRTLVETKLKEDILKTWARDTYDTYLMNVAIIMPPTTNYARGELVTAQVTVPVQTLFLGIPINLTINQTAVIEHDLIAE